MGFVKHETGCSQLFPLEVSGLHKIEQQLPISHKSQKPCAVPATSCTDPLRGSEKRPEQIHPQASHNAEDKAPAQGQLWEQCAGGRWSWVRGVHHHLTVVLMGC